VATTLRAVEKISAISYYHLSLISLYKIQLDAFLKQRICITIKQYGKYRYMHGDIISAQQLISQHSMYYYKVTAQSVLWRLNQNTDSRIFHQKNIQQLCQLLFKEHQLVFYKFKLARKHNVYLFQTQYNESALNFLSRLFNKEGIFYYIDYSANNSRLIISDSIEGCHFIKHSIVLETGRYHGPHIYDWQYRHRSFSTENQPIKVKAKSNIHTSAPGDVFTLKNHPLKSINGDYLITKVIHFADDYSKLPSSKSNVITQYRNIFECVPLLQSYPILIKTTIPKIYGIQTATVIKKSRMDTHAHNINGQVKVLFPWDHRKSGSSFVPVKQPLADQYCGLQFFPKEGNTVVVTFEQGDPNKPIILGSIYSKKEQMPFNPYSHGIKTVDGHEFSFSNKENDEKIVIKSTADMQTSIKGNSTIDTKNSFITDIKNGPLKIESHTFQIEARQSIKLNSANGSIEITPDKIILTGVNIALN
jgi:type VI secretion system secreted protein VgrG